MTNPARTALFTGALVLLAACPEASVSHSRIAKAPETPPPVVAAPADPGADPQAAPSRSPAAMGSMGQGDVPPPPKPSGAGRLEWRLPSGWTQVLTGGIRFATLKPAGAGNLDASVVVLSGPAGGELANVNRWRSQIGLPPLEEDSLASVRKSVTAEAGKVSLYDFTGEGVRKARLVAGLIVNGENTWFFKMTGDAEAVGKAMPDFTHLLQSLRLPSAN